MAPNTKVTKKWEIFAGRNKFYCDGYLMTAPHSGIFYVTVILITGTSVLFFAFDCPFLSDRITPAIPVIGGILYLFTMCSLLRTSFSDPGVIPRATHDESAYIEKQIEVPNSLNSPTYRPPPRTKEILVKGQTVKLKYCFTCKIFRPPRASHCSLCDNCVDRFDHHCPWVGNCVGKRNYRFFYMFIVSLAFLAVFIFSFATTHIVLLTKDDDEIIDVVKKTPFSFIIAVICFFSIWSVIGLAGFHTYLTTSDQTTNEDIKGSFSSKSGQQVINPYSHGNICLNCFHILCGPITPSLIDRRGIVTDEYRIQMQPQEIKYNNGLQGPPMVTQPVGSLSGDPITNGQYNIEIDPSLPNSGLYRQRSYDNLQNEKSNSVAHLVENEIPLSITSTAAQSSGLGILSSSLNDTTQITTILDDIDNSNVENNNINTSYNNLFRDSNNMKNLQNDDAVVDSNDDIMILSNNMNTTDSCKIENVYSNIPSTISAVSGFSLTNIIDHQQPQQQQQSLQTAQHQQITNQLPSPKILSLDANAHVYSNIKSASTAITTPPLVTTNPIIAAVIASGGGAALTASTATTMTTKSNNNNNISDTTPSIFLTNDLDLDDPVLSSSFNQTKPINHNNSNTKQKLSNTNNKSKKVSTTSNNNLIDNSSGSITTAGTTNNNDDNNKLLLLNANNEFNDIISSSSSTTGTTQISTIDVNNVVVVQPQQHQPKVNKIHSNIPQQQQQHSQIDDNLKLNNSNNSFINSNRMRLLQDTTMIDTALDLDSLDGSSLGNSNNNSQSCLVKTAIV